MIKNTSDEVNEPMLAAQDDQTDSVLKVQSDYASELSDWMSSMGCPRDVAEDLSIKRAKQLLK